MEEIARKIVKRYDKKIDENDYTFKLHIMFPEHSKAIMEWMQLPGHDTVEEGMESLLPLLVKYSTKLGRVLE